MKVEDKIRKLMGDAYDTGWLASRIENAGRPMPTPGYMADARNELTTGIEARNKLLAEILNELEAGNG